MRRILLILLSIVCGAYNVSAQQTNETKYFNYHITGSVTDERSRPAANISVCWVPAERPINGRIPCTKTDAAGKYDLAVKDIPDKYTIAASSGKYPPFMLGLDKSDYRGASSGVLIFRASDESRTIDLQLALYKWSRKAKEYKIQTIHR